MFVVSNLGEAGYRRAVIKENGKEMKPHERKLDIYDAAFSGTGANRSMQRHGKSKVFDAAF